MQTAWSTSLIPRYQRAEFWRSAVCDAFLAMTPRIARAQDFEARLDHLCLDRVTLNRVTAPAHGVSRTAADIRRDDTQVYFLNMSPRGRCHVRQQSREHTSQPGELVLIDSSIPYSIDLPEAGELVSLAIPREWLHAACTGAPDRTASRIEHSTLSHLLGQHMLELTRLPHIDAHQGGAISQVMVSLLAGALSHGVQSPTGSSARLRKVQKLIAMHFADPDFRPTQAAELAGMSLRSLHAAYAESAATFGMELQKYRLEQAHELLTKGNHDHAINRIALVCGFRSAEHFSRSFRKQFGKSPSQAKAQ